MISSLGGAQVIEKARLSQPSAQKSDTLFEAVERERSGLIDRNDYADPDMWGKRFLEFTLGAMGTGVAIGDYDRDGLPDLFVASKTESDRLFRNLGDFRFEDVTEESGVGGETGVWTQGVAFADVNGDGYLDLYVCRFGAPNFLYLNSGDGTFDEVGEEAGVAVTSSSGMASFSDYDRDGDLDFYLLTNLFDIRENPSGEPDLLFRNRGDGTFEDVTQAAGIEGVGQGHSATWMDYNADGWPDLYVANDFTPADKLYHNTGDGRFVDVLGYVVSRTPNSSMGADIADLNGDGLIDFMVADMATTTHEKDMRGMVHGREEATDPVSNPFAAQQYPRNAVYLNSGMGPFAEGAQAMGLAATDWTWSLRFEDFDNDGWTDLHVTNGMVRELHNTDLMRTLRSAKSPQQRVAVVKSSPPLSERNLSYRNLGDLRFEEVGAEWGLDEMGISFGAATGDLDCDGDLDLVYANYKKGVSMLRNGSQKGGRIVLELEGDGSNRYGIGALVTVETSIGSQTKALSLSRGYASTSEPILHFGLGEAHKADRVVVRWPSGNVQEIGELPAGYRYCIKEENTRIREEERRAEPLFSEMSRAIGLLHRSREGFLFERKDQPFLPRRHNRIGPALAIGELHGRGGGSVVVGGTSLDPLTIFELKPEGASVEQTPFRIGDPRVNDGPVLIFDADGDGWNDLLVTKGGVAAPSGDASYQPWLLLNDGAGNFDSSRTYALPDFPVSVGAAAVADYDRDGDLDLFLGGRVEPGDYPMSPRSALWENESGAFSSAGAKLLGETDHLGMVTDALWSDVDRDGWQDLIVVTKLGAVRCFRNAQGSGFVEASEDWGFDTAGLGAWNSIVAADFNSDGRMDYALGNDGLNTPYRASKAEPAVLLYGAFQAGGKKHLIEGKYEDGTLYPVRTWDVLKKRVPGLQERFSGNDAYAKASLEQVVGERFLQSSHRFEVTELRSGVLMSSPSGRHQFQPFPLLAQFAPFQGIAAGDFDGDGWDDLYALQNDFSPIPSVGRYDGGLSQLLRGDGAGGFVAVATQRSGLLVTGDARALCLTDIDDDGRPDFLLTRNHSSVLAYRNQAKPEGGTLRIELKGRPGNAMAIGSLLALSDGGGWSQIRELSCGGGGLGASSRYVFFGLPAGASELELMLRWPDGHVDRRALDPGQRILTIER
ncbi:FG-GAP-like repeat-containing protein [Pelagicoccus sp. SDUM812003]|uniref:FG-GAP-like repeat-containing protein n=1 Tax=Pelagicoccus sp. SDUM812003 TaxID=3041267 RepID=UPI00280D8117|nr:FG-GAP-like repeat-containing protein [Pelagicoccus sp. SDUM812003]MDQ8205526.1 FG-GAP-like repeat-containing protein [Pelagicoccus sp. SDUM812003]